MNLQPVLARRVCFHSALGERGHSYILEGHFTGAMDHTTGMIVNLTELDRILKTVIDPLDHRHLEIDVAYFKNHVPTIENLAQYLFHQIQEQIPAASFHLVKIRLFESEDFWVDYALSDQAL
jgi:6-pyruvoyltetrahydropterin/6-carboxytetrahydropterin synthase